MCFIKSFIKCFIKSFIIIIIESIFYYILVHCDTTDFFTHHLNDFIPNKKVFFYEVYKKISPL